MYDEIFKLGELLIKANIPHTLNHFYYPFGNVPIGYQIRIYKDKALTQELDDCVCHKFSHGYEQGLLETFNLGECEGFETAQEVFDGWAKMYAKALEG